MTANRVNFRTVQADARVRAGRLAKARQFLQVADDARELAEDRSVADAAVTLYIHAGIAAADAICAAALQRHAKGENHQQAVSLLASVDREASTRLRLLLGLKTRAGYGHDPVSQQNLVQAARAAQALVERAML